MQTFSIYYIFINVYSLKCFILCVHIIRLVVHILKYLSHQSQLIGDTAYDILWYDLRPTESQLLIPVILKSQKGFTLTFGKFSSLSLESFTSVSYFSVLNNFIHLLYYNNILARKDLQNSENYETLEICKAYIYIYQLNTKWVLLISSRIS